MRTLSRVIEHIYTNCLYGQPYECHTTPLGKSLFMTIPLTGEHIEVPVFATYVLADHTDKDAIVVTLNHTGSTGIYKSLPSNIRYALEKVYSPYHLVKLTPGGEDDYYATYGAIFNKDYHPVMLMTWEIDRVPDNSTSFRRYKYKMMRPVLRLAPEVFRKSNAVEKYIVNKILPETLALEDVDWPYNQSRYSFEGHPFSEAPTIKAVIENSPFSIRSANTPSVSTSNKDLLSVALNHLNELVQ